MLGALALKATNWNQDRLWSVLCEPISEFGGVHPGGGSSYSDGVAQVLSQQHSEVGNMSNVICLSYLRVLGVDFRFVITDVGVGIRRDMKLSNDEYSGLAKLLPELFIIRQQGSNPGADVHGSSAESQLCGSSPTPVASIKPNNSELDFVQYFVK